MLPETKWWLAAGSRLLCCQQGINNPFVWQSHLSWTWIFPLSGIPNLGWEPLMLKACLSWFLCSPRTVSSLCSLQIHTFTELPQGFIPSPISAHAMLSSFCNPSGVCISDILMTSLTIVQTALLPWTSWSHVFNILMLSFQRLSGKRLPIVCPLPTSCAPPTYWPWEIFNQYLRATISRV